jgi:UTP--glucose-1-phosphate uridylyltransferase
MKGVIVAAGYGTRFLPFTKTVPKEMIPLIDKPSIDFIIEEFIESGIDEILVITSRRKKVLEDYLDREIELETVFTAEGATAKLEKIVPPEASIYFVRQQQMRGTGHALLAAKPFVGNEPFVVAYPDDLHFGSPPLAKQLIDLYEKTGCSVLATLHDPPDIHRYASLAIAPDGLHVTDMVEKATPGTEPSREASIGRFLYSEGFLDALAEGWERHTGTREYYHVYGLQKQMEAGKVVYCRFSGERLDTGAPEGYIAALVRYASMVPEYRDLLRDAVKRIL